MGISRKTTTILAALGTAVAACSLGTAPAAASSGMETVLQDDPRIVGEDDPAKLDRTLAQIASVGVDTIRVSLFWYFVAPDSTRRHRPHFGPGGAKYSGAYGEWRWQRFDRIVKLAERNGLNVLFDPTGPAPRWATHGRARSISHTRPDISDFRDFVAAAGGRYSGSYIDPAARSSDPPQLPRVTRWSIWNEPNFPGWLLPQWKRVGRRSYRAVSPKIYRRLVDVAWKSLQSTHHRGDVILVGDTAPYGPHNPRRPGTHGLISPPQFVRELYCVNGRYRQFRGRAARVRGCPSTRASRRRFRSSHPALFHASGWAHHAYSLQRPPTFKGRRKDGAPLGALGRLTRALDRSQFRWGASSSNWPIWITEFGYQTMPPDPFRGVSWKRQAAWMSWAEYLAFRKRRVASFAQFLLFDDAPKAGFRASDPRRWVTWQSGLLTHSGQVKPSLEEFRRPIYVTPVRARRGRSARVFALYRTAPYDTPIDARIEFSSAGGPWQTLTSQTVTNPRGYLLRRVRPPGSGLIRVVWTDPLQGGQAASRAQYVSRR
jgi:hypothetical protein